MSNSATVPVEPEDNPSSPAQHGASTVLAFDFGTRQIGIAVGQTLTGTANPLTVLKAKDGQPNWTELLQHIADWQPDQLIVGLPLNMDGTESEFCQRARKFARRLHGRSACKVLMFDERLSTREAKSRDTKPHDTKPEAYADIQSGNQTRVKQKFKRASKPSPVSRSYKESPVDAMAACLILQSWLEQPEFAIKP